MRTFFTEKVLWPIKCISEFKHASNVRNFCSVEVFLDSEIFSSGEQQQQDLQHTKASLQEDQKWRWTEWFTNTLDEIYPPHKSAHGPGGEPLDAVMCTVGAASKISCCLSRSLFLNAIYYLQSGQELFYKKVVSKSATTVSTIFS